MPDKKEQDLKRAYFGALHGLNEALEEAGEAFGLSKTPRVVGMSEEVIDANLADQQPVTAKRRRNILSKFRRRPKNEEQNPPRV